MNVPISWLKQYVDIDCDTHMFVDKMTMSGSKVEAVEQLGHDITNVVVGKILKIERHPDADRLVVTQIDIGGGKTVQIVTAATNVFEGAVVPVSLDGANLAGGLKIKKSKIRGFASEGMMCSITELGYTKQDYPEAPEDGIYIFQNEPPLGSDARVALEILDEVVEFEITSNRPDCYSVLGIAREAAATFDKPFQYPEISVKEEAPGNINELIAVEIRNPQLCPRYVARVIKNVKIEPSPQWLRHRLIASGVRPINNIVDITNYVMLEMGQPMHAFDIDNITGRKIIVRNANDGETFMTLDGTERKLDASMLVISDCEKAVAIAGIMGGENSKVTGTASAILFESATFDGTNIRLSSKKLGLRTDSSGKFEKGLDPNLALTAVNRAAQLVELLNCGEVVKGLVDCYPGVRNERSVTFRPDNINALLGTEIPLDEMERYLARVEIKTTEGTEPGSRNAIIPTFRPDIEIEADIAEEVARLYGYDNIKATISAKTPTVGRIGLKQELEDIIKATMVAQGYHEALTYSFESPKVFDKLSIAADDPVRNTVKITNPLGEDFSIMRTLTINGMLQSLSTNYSRRNPSAHLFELAKVYLPKSLPLTELPIEQRTLTIGMCGNRDFYDIKGTLEDLFDELGVKGVVFSPKKDIAYMHPGRTAEITLKGEATPIGYVGEVNPKICTAYEIGTKAYIAVLNCDLLYPRATLISPYKPLPKFPPIERDIAMLVKDEVLIRDIEDAIRERGGKLLEEIALFDVYRGKQIADGCKSVAYKLTFRAADRTLVDDEVASAVKKILDNLEKKLGAVLRDK